MHSFMQAAGRTNDHHTHCIRWKECVLLLERQQTETGECNKIQVITKTSLLAAQREDLHKVMEMRGLKEQHARTLLIYHRWDVERLLAVFVDKGKDWLFSQAGVTLLEAMGSHPPSLPFVSNCNVCIKDKLREEMTMMDCGHYYCNDYWTANLSHD